MTSTIDASAVPDFIQGGGEMGALMRAHDWQATPLGPFETWSQPLRTALRLLLNSGHPMYIWWGQDLLCFYNDAYRQSIGPEQHPGSLGRKAREVWDEIWHIIGPQITQVMSGGGATWQENALVPITRNGRREDVYWTYSYSPLDDAAAVTGVGGVLVVCAETTAQVLAARRSAEERLKIAELNADLERRVAAALAERADAETHLRQAQKIDALGQLTGGVAHDFNNLLMVISGGLSLLERPLEPERRQRLLAQMRQASDRGASLSRQLLAFARRQPLKPETVDLRRQIDLMRELLDRTLRADVQVKTDLSPDLWPIMADPAELELVVLNLCVNARDAMPNGGTITISARNAGDIREGALSGDFVSVSIEDTGTGMSAEVLAHLFEPFYTTKEIGKGSGLGLPQVYGFAQQSLGSVTVDSVLGRGTKVTLLLPRTAASPMPETAPSVDLDTTARRRALQGSILLVEDDDEVASLVTEMLGELGYSVTRAASAQAALGALADDRAIDLVFSDVLMPGAMNGMDLAREVRRRRPAMPVLLTSGYSGAALADAAVENIGVLRKPYEIQALQTALRTALAGPPPS